MRENYVFSVVADRQSENGLYGAVDRQAPFGFEVSPARWISGRPMMNNEARGPYISCCATKKESKKWTKSKSKSMDMEKKEDQADFDNRLCCMEDCMGDVWEMYGAGI